MYCTGEYMSLRNLPMFLIHSLRRLRIHALDFVTSVAPPHTCRERVANVEGSSLRREHVTNGIWLATYPKKKSPLLTDISYWVCHQKSCKKEPPFWHLFLAVALLLTDNCYPELPKCCNLKNIIFTPHVVTRNLVIRAYRFHGQPSPQLAGFALRGSVFRSGKHSARFPFLVF